MGRRDKHKQGVRRMEGRIWEGIKGGWTASHSVNSFQLKSLVIFTKLKKKNQKLKNNSRGIWNTDLLDIHLSAWAPGNERCREQVLQVQSTNGRVEGHDLLSLQDWACAGVAGQLWSPPVADRHQHQPANQKKGRLYGSFQENLVGHWRN